jgi:undecaprenyl-diphosphatase
LKRENKRLFLIAAGALAAFVLWTVLVRVVDLQQIGPEGSVVGFAVFNAFVHGLTGVHMGLYELTDLLSVIPLAIIGGFGLLGLVQWIKRKSFAKVDYSILVLGGFYIVVLAIFALFEVLAINYRPVLIEGKLEASYPSSTTMLVMCVLPTAVMQLRGRIQNPVLNHSVSFVLGVFTGFMVVVRLISGVHWVTDIIGGALLSTGLVVLYTAFIKLERK